MCVIKVGLAQRPAPFRGQVKGHMKELRPSPSFKKIWYLFYYQKAFPDGRQKAMAHLQKALHQPKLWAYAT